MSMLFPKNTTHTLNHLKTVYLRRISSVYGGLFGKVTIPVMSFPKYTPTHTPGPNFPDLSTYFILNRWINRERHGEEGVCRWIFRERGNRLLCL